MTPTNTKIRPIHRFWLAIATLGLAILLVSVSFPPLPNYVYGSLAQLTGHWLAASEAFCRICESQDRITGSCYHCGRAKSQAIAGIPYANLAAERRLLDRLATDDLQQLAVALDRSRVLVPGGEFQMGSKDGRDDERPSRAVSLAPYTILRYEVTNVQYARFIEATDRKPPRYWSDGGYPAGLADSPVVGVSWQDASDYCAWAGGRLPSEAEWEKACRGPDGRIYPWGNDWAAEKANATEACQIPGGQYLEALWPVLETLPIPGQPGLHRVGSYPQDASPYGVLDLAGNASEWVADWYNPQAYLELPAENPLSVGPPWNHGLRGGSWWVFPTIQGVAAFENRCSARNGSHSADDPRLGFRCAVNQ